jgi:hypothetical protein
VCVRVRYTRRRHERNILLLPLFFIFSKVYRMLTLCRQKGESNVAHGGTTEARILSQGHDNPTAMKEHTRCDKIFLLRIHSISITTVKLLHTVFVFNVNDCVEYSLWTLLLHSRAVTFALNASKILTRRDMALCMVAPCIDDIKFFIYPTNAHKLY